MNKPIQRHKSLQPLSSDHHHGLLLCWKIRTGFKLGVEPERIKRYADWFWTTHLVPHFETEEQHVFPVLGNHNELVQQALEEHRTLKRLFESQTEVSATLSQIETTLEKHIRFEERVLFNAIQQVATPAQLADCEKHHREHPVKATWPDAFWKA